MADGTADVARALAQLTTALIEMMTRLSVALIERRAERLREAARHGEQRARQERARLARHRAADAAIWQRTTEPAWWARATPQQIARAWRAASTWHQVDADAAGARQAMAERLRARGVDVAQDLSANPGDTRWLQTALDLAMAEREERLAFRDDLDTDAELADQLMWDLDEQPRNEAGQAATPAEANAKTDAEQTAAQQAPATAEISSEVLWDADEKPAVPQETGKANGVRLDLAAFDAAQATSVTATTDAAVPPEADRRASLLQAAAQQTATATQPNDPGRLPAQEMTRMAGLLQAAWHTEPDRAQRVLEDGAWPALASSMHRLDARGKDVQGLLSKLDAATTDSSVPAVTTDWALRAAAAGPVAAQRMKAGRQAHQARLTTARQQPTAKVVMQQREDLPERRRGNEESSTEAARLLAAAFPQSTKTALNRQRPGQTTGSDRPSATRDRVGRRERETAQPER